MKLKEGAIVKTLNGLHWIVLNVSKFDWTNGVNCDKPGLHLFTGYWYSFGEYPECDAYRGHNKNINHKCHGCYGKINPCDQPLKVVGYARNSYLMRKKMRKAP